MKLFIALEPEHQPGHTSIFCVQPKMSRVGYLTLATSRVWLILHYATFTLCPRRPRQSLFRPPWTKRGDREVT